MRAFAIRLSRCWWFWGFIFFNRRNGLRRALLQCYSEGDEAQNKWDSRVVGQFDPLTHYPFEQPIDQKASKT